ncbi:MAG: hypothetical protein NWF04_05250 [Candidatus Bathyarchaeota archaeon]|nr:hypothetical protein [Candidatus Bathyarchaeota archaeon]
MIKEELPFCDECGKQLTAWTTQEALSSDWGGWPDWKTAQKHYCKSCHDQIVEEWEKDADFPACGLCETYPCKQGLACWDDRCSPIEKISHKNFFGELAAKPTIRQVATVRI